MARVYIPRLRLASNTNIVASHRTDERLALELEPPGSTLLVVLKQPNSAWLTRLLDLERELLIGRDPAADLCLTGALVSRRHVRVRAAGGGLEIEDISSNGTLVDGIPLSNGCLAVGRACALIVGCNLVRLRRV